MWKLPDPREGPLYCAILGFDPGMGDGSRGKVESEESTVLCLVAQLCLSLFDPMDSRPPGSSVHGDSPGKNTGVDCHDLLQGIFPTQGSNPDLPHLQADSLLERQHKWFRENPDQ